MLRRIKCSGVGCVLPTVLVVAAVTLYPLFYTLIMGFSNSTLFMQTPVFRGISQYKRLFEDKVFMGSISNTSPWTFRSVFFQSGLGSTMALVFRQLFVKGKMFIHILLMIPWVMPNTIGSVARKWMYNTDYGIIDFIFCSFGIIEMNQTRLSNPETTMWPVIAVNTWKIFPFILLMIEAAPQSVSKDFKEAAIIGGANILDIFKNVTWPPITVTCYPIIPLMITWILNVFTLIYAMTEGGPAHKTEIMAVYIYKRAFVDHDLGMASAANAVLLALSMLVSFVCLYPTGEKEGK